MPTKNEFVSIFLLTSSGESAPAIADILGISERTVGTARKLAIGFEAGMSNEELVAHTNWGEKTCGVGRAARIEVRENAARRKNQARVLAKKFADAVGIPLNREVLHPDATKWFGNGLKGNLGEPITFTFESDRGWPWLLDMLPLEGMDAYKNTRDLLTKFGQAILGIRGILLKRLPHQIDSLLVVQSPRMAHEACVVSIYKWLSERSVRGESYKAYIGGLH